MTALAELLQSLASAPVLPGARCRGRWELFDAATDTTRGTTARATEDARQAATALCAQCPALDPCRDWLDQLPADQRPHGVIAGQVLTAPKPPSRAERNAERDERIITLHQSGMDVPAIAAATGTSRTIVWKTLRIHRQQPREKTP